MTAFSPIASLLAALTAQLASAPPAPTPASGFLELLTEVEIPDEEPAVAKEQEAEEPEPAAGAWAGLFPVVPAEVPPPPVNLDMPSAEGEVVVEAPAERLMASEEIEVAEAIAPKSDGLPQESPELLESPAPASSAEPPHRVAPEAPPTRGAAVPAVAAPIREMPVSRASDGPEVETATPPREQTTVEVAPRLEELRGEAVAGPPARPAGDIGRPEVQVVTPAVGKEATEPRSDVKVAAGPETPVELAAPVVERPPLERHLAEPRPDAVERPTPPPEAARAQAEAAASTVREAARVQLAFAARLRPSPPPPPIGGAPKPEIATGVDRPAQRSEEPGKRETPRVAAPDAVVERPPEQRDAAWIPAPRGVDGPPAPERESAVESTATPVKVAPRRESPLPAPVARDIRLEIGTPERKVEVRLVERAGEVHLAVRTPDSRLADGLREQLPELSARLERSGFRADEWRAAEAGAPERRVNVEASGGGSTDARQQGQSQDGKQERREGEPRAPRGGEPDNARHKQKGNAFAWLMESLR